MLELLIAPWFALAPPEVAGDEGTAPTPADGEVEVDLSEAARLFDEGLARYEAADYEAAIEIFTQALAELREQGVHDFRTRGLLLFNIGRAHMRAYEIDEDVEHLRQAQAIFRRFTEEGKDERNAAEADPGDVREAEEQLAIIAGLLESESASEPVDPAPAPAPVDADEAPSNARPLGIGLTATGVALLGGGVGMLIWGVGYGPAAQAEVDTLDGLGLPDDHPAFAEGDQFIRDERKKGTAWMAAGGVAAGLGVGVLAVGIQQLVRANKQRRPPVTAVGSFERGFVFVGVAGRF